MLRDTNEVLLLAAIQAALALLRAGIDYLLTRWKRTSRTSRSRRRR